MSQLIHFVCQIKKKTHTHTTANSGSTGGVMNAQDHLAVGLHRVSQYLPRDGNYNGTLIGT